MLFALHPAECYYNTAIFHSTLREERQYICHLTKHTKPTLCAVIDVLYYCWRWRQEKDNATLYNTTPWKEMCSICLDTSFFSPALTRSFALPPARANLCPPSRCRNYPLSRQASSRFTHIPYIPPLRGCRSDQRNSCKNMAGWRCPRLYLLWELSGDSHH